MNSYLDLSDSDAEWLRSGPAALSAHELFAILKVVLKAAEELKSGGSDTTRVGDDNGNMLFVRIADDSKALAQILNQNRCVDAKFSFTLDAAGSKQQQSLGLTWHHDDPQFNDPIEDLHLPTRAYNCLSREGIRTVGQLVEQTDKQLKAIRIFGGQDSIDAVDTALASRGLSRKKK